MKNSFKKFYLPLSLLFIFLLHLPFVFGGAKPVSISVASFVKASEKVTMNVNFRRAILYDSLQLDTLGLSKQAFIEALKGFDYLRSNGKLSNDNVLTIADFSLPSNQKRLFVIDMDNYEVLYNTYVAHGRNSGKEFANRFSNSPHSNMSSLGFYVTQNTYFGDNGFSLRLQGEEKGINDNAERRAIVIHCADYVSEKWIQDLGYIGRSLGCPALPRKVAKPIIETIKDGSCFFIYSPNQKYLSKSKLLHQAS
ncbi:MAG TPA: murein L,D-transpeptidase catalytic domain family protein [Hanamia sp.]|nr:murein L,D-transpeptidase catalytic domain family protein [Hanamia sp.]